MQPYRYCPNYLICVDNTCRLYVDTEVLSPEPKDIVCPICQRELNSKREICFLVMEPPTHEEQRVGCVVQTSQKENQNPCLDISNCHFKAYVKNVVLVLFKTSHLE